jgi:hypothetical protein
VRTAKQTIIGHMVGAIQESAQQHYWHFTHKVHARRALWHDFGLLDAFRLADVLRWVANFVNPPGHQEYLAGVLLGPALWLFLGPSAGPGAEPQWATATAVGPWAVRGAWGGLYIYNLNGWEYE